MTNLALLSPHLLAQATFYYIIQHSELHYKEEYWVIPNKG